MIDDIIWITLFYNISTIHEYDFSTYFSRKTHFMSDNNHCHTLTCKIFHNS